MENKLERILFYISGFDVFDNFSAHAVEYDGVLYMTSEQAYQSAKFDDESIRRKVREARSPVLAKGVAGKNKEHQRKDWSDIKVSIMESILLCKMQQHQDVRTALLGSGDREIVENSASDYFWGCGADNAGRNELGKAWMRIREKLRAGGLN